MYGLHFTDTLVGKTFFQTVTPLGLAIPIYTATAIGGAGVNSLPIWNPPQSNRIVEVVQYDINYGSGTADFGSIVIMALPLTAIATGALCTAFTETTPNNGYLGGGNTSKVKSANGAGTVTVTAGVATSPFTVGATAPGPVRSLGDINLEAQTGTAHGVGMHTYALNGTLSVPPGVMIYLAATKASVALYCSTVVWKEHIISPAAN